MNGWTHWIASAASAAAVATMVGVLVSVCMAGWILTLMGMPGNWLIAVAALGFDFTVHDEGRLLMGKWIIIALFGLAALGEVLESATGAVGVASKGGSRRGTLGAVAGSMLGGFGGAMVGIPIPVVGPVLAAVLFAAAGAMAGTILLEKSAGKDMHQSIDIGVAAMKGRIAGSLSKALVGALMVALVCLGLVF